MIGPYKHCSGHPPSLQRRRCEGCTKATLGGCTQNVLACLSAPMRAVTRHLHNLRPNPSKRFRSRGRTGRPLLRPASAVRGSIAEPWPCPRPLQQAATQKHIDHSCSDMAHTAHTGHKGHLYLDTPWERTTAMRIVVEREASVAC